MKGRKNEQISIDICISNCLRCFFRQDEIFSAYGDYMYRYKKLAGEQEKGSNFWNFISRAL